MISINLQCQENCLVTSRFTITLRRDNKFAEEFQRMSNKHGCF